MYILNDICYAGEPTENMKVTEAVHLRGGMLLVRFSSGERRLFDTTLLQGSAFEPLKDESIVSKPEIFHGIITWDNGKIDISPEAVYQLSYPYEEDPRQLGRAKGLFSIPDNLDECNDEIETLFEVKTKNQ